MKLRYYTRPGEPGEEPTRYVADLGPARGLYVLTGRRTLSPTDLEAMIEMGFRPEEIPAPAEDPVIDTPITQAQLQLISSLMRERKGNWEQLDAMCRTKFGQPVQRITRTQASKILNAMMKKKFGPKRK